MNRVSVIIVNFNGIELLPECLNSISQQSLMPHEIIIVDNGSTDDSVKYLKKNYPVVKIIELEKNLGFAKGNNLGIKHAEGDYIALINNDAVADPRWLEEMVGVLENSSDARFCTSKILNYYDHSIIDSAGDYIGIAKAYKRGNERPDTEVFNKQEYVFSACAGSAMYRRSMLDETGLFDEMFISNLEDVDLSFRAQLQGYKCLYVPEAVVFHKVGETKKKIGWTGRLTFRNNKIFWLKNVPLKLLFKYFPRMMINDLELFLGNIKRIFSGNVKHELRKFIILTSAYIEVFLLIPIIIVKRAGIQRRRKIEVSYIDDEIKKGEILSKKR